MGFNENIGQTADKVISYEEIKKKYPNGKLYEINTTVEVDDENEKGFKFFFQKPSVQSYDRYVKTAANSNVKALRAFIMDNIVQEQKTEMSNHLEEYPAAALSIGEKLLSMLGFSKDITVKKL